MTSTRARSRAPRTAALLAAVLLAAATALAGCAAPAAPSGSPVPTAATPSGATSTPPVPSTPRASPTLFLGAAAASAASGLTSATGMAFGSAGPHHVVGRAPDGVELDIVGSPVTQVVLSVPAPPGTDPGPLAARYLSGVATFGGIDPTALIAWVESVTADWNRAAALLATSTVGGWTAELRTIGDPRYLRLNLVAPG
jgi:hypothetical protein